jgi:RNA-binding protein YhbY
LEITGISITAIIAIFGAVVAGAGSLAALSVYLVGRHREAESKMSDRALEAAQQTIDIQDRELAKVRQRFDAHEEERRDLLQKLMERDARVAELSGHEMLLERYKEDNVKLTNAIKAMNEGTPVDVKALLNMVTSVASGAEIKRVNGGGEPPVERVEKRIIEEEHVDKRTVSPAETEVEERMRLQERGGP